MTNLINISNTLTMSSIEISDLTGKRHDHVMTDIDRLLKELEINAPDFMGTQKYGNNNTRNVYYLQRRECDLLMMGYSTNLRAKVYDRWVELEQDNKPIKEYTELELARNYVKVLERKEELEKHVQFLEPFKTKVDNSMAIFPNKESTDEGERVYKKYLREKYPFIGNNSITNILEYYTKYKYKETKSYLKTEVDTAIKEFFDTCSYDISEQKLTVIIKHDCLLSGQMQVKKEHAIKYLNYTEEDFE